MNNVHEGHRERLKKRFKENGLESFTDIEALELLLFFALPRRDTNVIAHALLDRFKSFKGVLEADRCELAGVTGVGESAALLLSLVPELNRRYMTSRREKRALIDSSDAAGEYLMPLFAYKMEELAYILCLDSRSQVVCCRNIAQGMVNKVDFTVRDIVDITMKNNAARVILAHNHLSGTALPSKTDISTTARIKSALNLIGVELTDHIIVCEDDFVSMCDSGFFTQF